MIGLEQIISKKQTNINNLFNKQQLNNNPFNQLAPNIGGFVQEKQFLKDHKIVKHVASILANINNIKHPQDISQVSNIVKQTTINQPHIVNNKVQVPVPLIQNKTVIKIEDCYIRKFSLDYNRLNYAGLGISKQDVLLIDKNLIKISKYFGRILGTQRDYYIIQGIKSKINQLNKTQIGCQKQGQGINYYSFWVTNNLIDSQWAQLPLIKPHHIKISRKIKKYFSGNLDYQVVSSPSFQGNQSHYLKAQLVRICHSLQLLPKGVMKTNQQNPKNTQYQDQIKIPQVSQLSTIQNWVHKNTNILQLGRCTHFIDPNTPQDQLQTITADLAANDPQLQRLRSIIEDKLPQGSPLGLQNIWTIKLLGNNQVFQKDDGSFVYGTVVIKNIYWPGWTTIAYKNGFINYYNGNGLKNSQPAWTYYDPNTLGIQAEPQNQPSQPNPKQAPKPPQPVNEQVPPPEQ